MTRWAALLAVVALACVVSRPRHSHEEVPGSRIGFSRPPAVDGDRTACVQPQYSGGECTHDGQCVRSGCGNHCISWEYGGANEGATCEGYSLGEPTFCGCVEQRCAWFTQ